MPMFKDSVITEPINLLQCSIQWLRQAATLSVVSAYVTRNATFGLSEPVGNNLPWRSQAVDNDKKCSIHVACDVSLSY